MKDAPIDWTAALQRAEKAADEWVGQYTWAQQGGVPNILDINRILRALWIHGYMAGLTAATDEARVTTQETSNG